MKDTTKWIIGAIVVLLIVLVGAYALSNGSNQPASNTTVTPEVTVTPAPTTEATATATAAPTSSPSATPAPTAAPTPSAGSGVKQTEFGYYITYPPFSHNEVFANPSHMAPGATPTPTATPTPSTDNAVMFTSDEGTIWVEDAILDTWYTDAEVRQGGQWVDVYVPMERTGDVSAPLSVSVTITTTDGSFGYVGENPVIFAMGDTHTIYTFSIPMTYLESDPMNNVILHIEDSSLYTVAPYQDYVLRINPEV
jgi:hypothetical protein